MLICCREGIVQISGDSPKHKKGKCKVYFTVLLTLSIFYFFYRSELIFAMLGILVVNVG